MSWSTTGPARSASAQPPGPLQPRRSGATPTPSPVPQGRPAPPRPATPPLAPSEYPTNVHAAPPSSRPAAGPRSQWSTPGPRRATHECRPPKSPCSTTPFGRCVEFCDQVRQTPVAEVGAGRQTGRLGDDRSGNRQRHRHPRRAGLPVSRNVDPDPAGHRDPRHQCQRDVRQRHPDRLGDPDRGRRGHRGQRRPGGQRWSAGAPQRNRSRDAHRRPGGARRPVRRRQRQTTAHRHLADRASRHADRGDRRIRRRKEHAGPADRRLHDAQLRLGDVRGPRHSQPSTPRCAAGSAWSPRTTSCTAS